ncbi:MAG: hypothetical protein IPO97_13260 [Sphingomonadales bacterium]|nr:hypothetical protein [Sphingomonadales bacterium]
MSPEVTSGRSESGTRVTDYSHSGRPDRPRPNSDATARRADSMAARSPWGPIEAEADPRCCVLERQIGQQGRLAGAALADQV